MASKAIYSVVAVVGIAAASGAAYWFQNKPKGPQEMTAAGPGAAAPAAGASAAGGPGRGPGGPAGVEVAKVEITKLQDDAQSVGSLRSRQNVMLRPEVAGRVQTMGFSDGGRVRKGDVLVQLDDVLQRAEVSQGLAQVSIARANLKRNQELVAQSFIAQRVVDEAAANVQVVEAQMALACARWERMRILSPFDGTAGIRNINIGDFVKDGADLVNIEDLSSMYVDFRLPERFQGKVRRDQQVELQLDAMPGRLFKAKIEAIDPQIDANGRSIGIRAVMPNSGGEPLVQRPAGAPGAGASAPAGGSVGGARGGAGAGAGMAKPAAKPVAKAPARPASGAGAAPKPVDPIAASCAANTASMRASTVVAGAGGLGSGARGAGAAGAGAAGAGAAGAGSRGGSAGAGAGERNASAAAGAMSSGAGQAAGQRSGAAGRPAGAGGPGAGGGGGGPLRPGMFARVTAVFNIKDKSLTVPEEAIVPQGGRQFVIKVVSQTEDQYKILTEAAKVAAAAAAASASASGASAPVVSAAPAAQPPVFVDGKRLVSQRVEVKIGIRRPGRVELTEGVEEGDTVVVAGQQRLQRDNIPVRIVELGRPPGGPGGTGGSGGPSGPGGAPGGGAPAAPANAATGTVMSAPAASPATPASR
jgi:multidrug efflux pump subunit AcrA (membrane-fusion protein)